MTQDDGAALVRRYFAAAVADDLDVFEDLFAPDYVNHRPDGGENRGPAGMKEFIRGVLERFPGLAVDVQDLFADGDKVAARITLRGASASTGTAMDITEIQLYRIADGKIAERWYAVDRSGLPR